MMRAQRMWFVLPVVLTVVVAAAYLVASGVVEHDQLTGAAWWLPGVLALGQAAALLLRERAPIVVLGVVLALDLVVMVMTVAEIGTTAFGVMVAVYTVARRRYGRARWWAVGAAAAVELVVVAIAAQGSDEIPLWWELPFAVARVILVVAIPIVVADVVSGRARLLDALRERAETAERDRERRAREAVQRERTLMARELHDVAAHHLTGIIVSAQAASALLANDPARAREYLDTVQRDARTTLTNLRQTVGLLRSDAQGELAPVPSLTEIPSLVADAAAAGTDVRLAVSGDLVDLGPLAGVAAYRMVQESLVNAARHAPGATVSVEVAVEPTSVHITVENGPGTTSTGTAAHDGYGLLGMAERAELIGASLTSGPVADGGWRNVLTIPREKEHA